MEENAAPTIEISHPKVLKLAKQIEVVAFFIIF